MTGKPRQQEPPKQFEKTNLFIAVFQENSTKQNKTLTARWWMLWRNEKLSREINLNVPAIIQVTNNKDQDTGSWGWIQGNLHKWEEHDMTSDWMQRLGRGEEKMAMRWLHRSCSLCCSSQSNFLLWICWIWKARRTSMPSKLMQMCMWWLGE